MVSQAADVAGPAMRHAGRVCIAGLPLSAEDNMAFKPLQEQYKEDVVPALMDEFQYKSVM